MQWNHVVSTSTNTLEHVMILFTLLYASLSTAMAQTLEKNKPTVKTVEFGRVKIKGQLNGPEGSHIKENKKIIFNPLVQIRHSFSEEMQKSIDNL